MPASLWPAFSKMSRSTSCAASLRTNFFGQVALTRAALPYFRRQRAGHILMISSVSGLCGAAGTGSYSASKFALEGWSESLRLEMNPLGVRVVLIEPGLVPHGHLGARRSGCPSRLQRELAQPCARPALARVCADQGEEGRPRAGHTPDRRRSGEALPQAALPHRQGGKDAILVPPHGAVAALRADAGEGAQARRLKLSQEEKAAVPAARTDSPVLCFCPPKNFIIRSAL